MTIMERLRRVIDGKEQWERLISYIELIENNIDENPNVSLDGAKSILEAICKTILENKGENYRADSTLNRLVKKTYQIMPVFIALENSDQQSALRILGSLESIASSIGEFRNRYGFFSHGQDLQSQIFDRYLVDLVFEVTDVLSSSLIRAHEKDYKDRKRIFYEDHTEFNKWFDETNGVIEVGGIIISPSKALFEQDIEAYKENMWEYVSDADNNSEIKNDEINRN